MTETNGIGPRSDNARPRAKPDTACNYYSTERCLLQPHSCNLSRKDFMRVSDYCSLRVLAIKIYPQPPFIFSFYLSFLCLLLFLRKCVKIKHNEPQIRLFSSNSVLHTMPEVSRKENVIHKYVTVWNQIRETHNLSVTSACKVKLQIWYLLHINTLCFQNLLPQSLGNLWGPAVNSNFILDSSYTYIKIKKLISVSVNVLLNFFFIYFS